MAPQNKQSKINNFFIKNIFSLRTKPSTKWIVNKLTKSKHISLYSKNLKIGIYKKKLWRPDYLLNYFIAVFAQSESPKYHIWFNFMKISN